MTLSYRTSGPSGKGFRRRVQFAGRGCGRVAAGGSPPSMVQRFQHRIALRFCIEVFISKSKPVGLDPKVGSKLGFLYSACLFRM